MDERTFEIILSRYPEDLLPASWALVGQQVGGTAGTLDLLFRDRRGVRHAVELKRGPATIPAVDQALRYTEATAYKPWVVAHRIPLKVQQYAATVGVRTLAVTAEACELALVRRGLTLAEVMPLRRRTPGVLTSGPGGVWSAVENEEAFDAMPVGMSNLLITDWNAALHAEFWADADTNRLPGDQGGRS